MDYKDMVLELSGEEGSRFADLEVTGFMAEDGKWQRIKPAKDIIFYVEVVGFTDKNAPSRNWNSSPEYFEER